jgi:gamma-tubulin complex component 4
MQLGHRYDAAAEVEAIGVRFARQSTSLYTILRSNRLANDPKAPYLRWGSAG